MARTDARPPCTVSVPIMGSWNSVDDCCGYAAQHSLQRPLCFQIVKKCSARLWHEQVK